MELTGQIVRLGEFRAADVDQVHALIGDDRVTRWLSFDSRSREQSATMLEGVVQRAQWVPRTEYYLAVCPIRADHIVGFVRLGLNGMRAGKLGAAVQADHQRRGYGTDAVQLIIEFGLDVLGLHRITAAIGPDNATSIAGVTGLGFKYEGRLRDHVHTNGAWRDSLLYSLLADDRHQTPAG